MLLTFKKMENNTSYSVPLQEKESVWYVTLTSLFMIIMAITTICGNIFVIHAVFSNRALRIVPNFFIVSLAVADLLVAVLVMPFHISINIVESWMFGEIMCHIWLTCDVLLCTASILNLCIIALDRYWAIHDPIEYAQKRTIKRVLIMIAMSWALSAIISIPPVFGWGESDNLYNAEQKSCTLSSDKGYVLYSACGSFYIPLIVMSFVYINIYIATKRRLRERTKAAKQTKLAMMNITNTDKNEAANKPRSDSESTNEDDGEQKLRVEEDNIQPVHSSSSGMQTVCVTDPNENHKKAPEKKSRTRDRKRTNSVKRDHDDRTHRMHNRTSINNFFEEKQRISLSKERKAARTLAIIMVTFVICWIPFFLMYLILPFCDTCIHPGVKIEVLVVWLGYLNSTLNPITYTVFNMEFRKAFNVIIARCRGKDARRVAMARTYI